MYFDCNGTAGLGRLWQPCEPGCRPVQYNYNYSPWEHEAPRKMDCGCESVRTRDKRVGFSISGNRVCLGGGLGSRALYILRGEHSSRAQSANSRAT